MGPSNTTSYERSRKIRQLRKRPANQELRAMLQTIVYTREHLQRAMIVIPETSGDTMIPGLAETLAALDRMLLVIQVSVLSFPH